MDLGATTMNELARPCDDPFFTGKAAIDTKHKHLPICKLSIYSDETGAIGGTEIKAVALPFSSDRNHHYQHHALAFARKAEGVPRACARVRADHLAVGPAAS